MPLKKLRKKIFTKETKIVMTSPLAEQHMIKKSLIYSLSKCNSKEVYSLKVYLDGLKTMSQIYFEKLFQNKEIEWNCIIPYAVLCDYCH